MILTAKIRHNTVRSRVQLSAAVRLLTITILIHGLTLDPSRILIEGKRILIQSKSTMAIERGRKAAAMCIDQSEKQVKKRK